MKMRIVVPRGRRLKGLRGLTKIWGFCRREGIPHQPVPAVELGIPAAPGLPIRGGLEVEWERLSGDTER